MDDPIRTKYQVFKANIMDDDGNKVLAGEIVALSPKLARHYNKLGFLRPVLEDEPEEEETDEDDEEPTVPLRSRRTTTLAGGAAVPTGNTTKPL